MSSIETQREFARAQREAADSSDKGTPLPLKRRWRAAAICISVQLFANIQLWAAGTNVTLDGGSTSAMANNPTASSMTIGPTLSLSLVGSQPNTDDNTGNHLNSINSITLKNGGELDISTDNAISTGAAISFSSGAGSTWNLNDNSQTIGGLLGSGTTGTISLGFFGGGTLTVKSVSNTATTFNGTITGPGGFTKDGASGISGTLVLGGANDYNGSTVVNKGTLQVSGALSGTSDITVNSGGTLLLAGSGGSNTKLNNTATVTLAGGTLSTSAITSSLDQKVGTLTLSGNSVIDFGSSPVSNTLRFDNSSGITWSGTLSIYNWNPTLDSIYFGNSFSGLTTAQLSEISFYGGNGTGLINDGKAFIQSDGSLSAIPEPSTIAVGIGLMGLVAWRERKRFSRSTFRIGTGSKPTPVTV